MDNIKQDFVNSVGRMTYIRTPSTQTAHPLAAARELSLTDEKWCLAGNGILGCLELVQSDVEWASDSTSAFIQEL